MSELGGITSGLRGMVLGLGGIASALESGVFCETGLDKSAYTLAGLHSGVEGGLDGDGLLEVLLLELAMRPRKKEQQLYKLDKIYGLVKCEMEKTKKGRKNTSHLLQNHTPDG